MATGWVFHELYLWHNTFNWNQFHEPGLTIQPGEHAENPETKRRFRNLLEVSGLLDHMVNIKPRDATVDELLRLHTQQHIDHIRALSDAGGGDASDATPMGKGSYEIALLAAGGAIEAFDAVVTGAVDNAYALCRPPGHHALPDLALGFCLFGNAAIAIKHVQAVHGLERIATVDWDVHHGNGTEVAFYDDPGVLSISIHQDNLFPHNSGEITRTGEGAGAGCNINIPLPPGAGGGAYIDTMERVVLPALERYTPELIVVPCGFDASAMDPLGRMMLSSITYRRMTEMVLQAAQTLCNGRLVMTHEGGYSASYVPYCGLTVIETMLGIDSGIEDPWSDSIEAYAGQELTPHQSAIIDEAAKLVSDVPAG
jgi:acetoin utilization deacetylase AcuC-like enzyme